MTTFFTKDTVLAIKKEGTTTRIGLAFQGKGYTVIQKGDASPKAVAVALRMIADMIEKSSEKP